MVSKRRKLDYGTDPILYPHIPEAAQDLEQNREFTIPEFWGGLRIRLLRVRIISAIGSVDISAAKASVEPLVTVENEAFIRTFHPALASEPSAFETRGTLALKSPHHLTQSSTQAIHNNVTGKVGEEAAEATEATEAAGEVTREVRGEVIREIVEEIAKVETIEQQSMGPINILQATINPHNPFDLTTSYGQYATIHLVTSNFKDKQRLEQLINSPASDLESEANAQNGLRAIWLQEIEAMTRDRRLQLSSTSADETAWLANTEKILVNKSGIMVVVDVLCIVNFLVNDMLMCDQLHILTFSYSQ
ncbi:hypothetical protein B7463_g127, partial [Scytalidium lignicola]